MDEAEKQRNYALAERLLSEQNFAAAVIGGAAAAVLAAAAYGITVSRWPFTYGFAATGIGIAVGLPMGFLGRGIAAKFAIAAALFTIVGCFLGNLFRALLELAPAAATSLIDVVRSSSFAAVMERATDYTFSIALIYWLVAVICAVFLARRALSRPERLAIGMLELRN